MRRGRRAVMAVCCWLLAGPRAFAAAGDEPAPKAPEGEGQPRRPSPPPPIDLSDPARAQKSFERLLGDPRAQALLENGRAVAVRVKTAGPDSQEEAVALRRMGASGGEPGAVVVGDGKPVDPAALKALGDKGSAVLVSPVRGLASTPAGRLAVAEALSKDKSAPIILAPGEGGTRALAERLVRSGGLRRPVTLVDPRFRLDAELGAALLRTQGPRGLNVSPDLASALRSVPGRRAVPAAAPLASAPGGGPPEETVPRKPVPLFASPSPGAGGTGRPLSAAEELTFRTHMRDMYLERARLFGAQASAAREDAVTAAEQSRHLAVLGNTLKEYTSRFGQLLDRMGAGMFDHPGRTAADFTPVLGTALAVRDLAEDPSWLGAGVLAASVVPGAKGVLKAELRAAAREGRALENELQAALRTEAGAAARLPFKDAALKYLHESEKARRLDPEVRQQIEELIGRGQVTRYEDIAALVERRAMPVDFDPRVGSYRNANGSGESAASLEAGRVKGEVFLVKADGTRVPLIGPRAGEDAREGLSLKYGERIERVTSDGKSTVLDRGPGAARPELLRPAPAPGPEPAGVVELSEDFGLSEADLAMFEAMRSK